MKILAGYWLFAVVAANCFAAASETVKVREPKTFDLGAIDKYVAAQIKDLGLPERL